MTTKRFWTVTFLVIGAALFAILFLPGFSRYNELHEKEVALTAEINKLEQENARLRKDKALLQHDMTRLEEAMRSRLGKVKPGEVVYKVVEVPDSPKSTDGKQ